MNKKAVFLTLVFVLTCIFVSALGASAQADFKDDFSDVDYASNGWYRYVLLGNPNSDYVYTARRRLSFRMPDYDTALYFLNSNTTAEDSTVEATFENVFSSNAQYAVVCRHHDFGWYEFRIVTAGEHAGAYMVYKYDQYLKSQGKAPYVVLHPGMDRYYSYDIKLGINAVNTLKMICEGNEIRVFINGNEQFPIKNGVMRDNDFTDGDNGILIWTQRPSGAAQIDLTGFSSTVSEK